MEPRLHLLGSRQCQPFLVAVQVPREGVCRRPSHTGHWDMFRRAPHRRRDTPDMTDGARGCGEMDRGEGGGCVAAHIPLTCPWQPCLSAWLRAGPAPGGGGRSEGSSGQMQPARICALREIEDDRLWGGRRGWAAGNLARTGRRCSWAPGARSPHPGRGLPGAALHLLSLEGSRLSLGSTTTAATPPASKETVGSDAKTHYWYFEC